MIYWQLMDINGWRNVCLLLYGKLFPRKFNGNQCEPRKNAGPQIPGDCVFLHLIVLLVAYCKYQKIAIGQLAKVILHLNIL